MSLVSVYRYHDPIGDWDDDRDEGTPRTEPDPVRVGSFSYEKARRWSDEDERGNGGRGTGRGYAVLLTSTGRWVLEHWTRWNGEEPRHEYISAEEAREWLLGNGFDEAAAEHFGPTGDERGPGRPEVGGAVHVRLGGELLAMVDAYAAERGINRAEAIRRLTQDAVTRARVASSSPLSPRDNR